MKDLQTKVNEFLESKGYTANVYGDYPCNLVDGFTITTNMQDYIQYHKKYIIVTPFYAFLVGIMKPYNHHNWTELERCEYKSKEQLIAFIERNLGNDKKSIWD